tara:strand:+ start:246 stop:458 length:213 start_codon:yes stop_codon:yes gene_type:complete
MTSAAALARRDSTALEGAGRGSSGVGAKEHERSVSVARAMVCAALALAVVVRAETLPRTDGTTKPSGQAD